MVDWWFLVEAVGNGRMYPSRFLGGGYRLALAKHAYRYGGTAFSERFTDRFRLRPVVIPSALGSVGVAP